MTFEEITDNMAMTETTDDMVERIAKAWYEQPCPPEDGPFCNPEIHNWATAHPEDQAWARHTVRFVLREAGLAD